MKNLNIPNRLSILRMCLVPVCVLLFYLPGQTARTAALIVFCIAAFTDFLDGQIARRQHIVTTFGKFIDPVADKLLVLSTMIALCGLGEFPAWACIVVLFRELAVDGLRLVASQQGSVIAAGKLGKIKTCTQLLTLILFLLDDRAYSGSEFTVRNLMVWLVVAMTLWSGIDYFWKNRSVLSLKEETK